MSETSRQSFGIMAEIAPPKSGRCIVATVQYWPLLGLRKRIVRTKIFARNEELLVPSSLIQGESRLIAMTVFVWDAL